MSQRDFEPVRVTRRTQETEFALLVEPRTEPMPSLPVANLLLSHFIDHLARAAAIRLRLERTEWPGSWRFDHVLCEDLGQLVGRAVLDIHDQRARVRGVPGRGQATTCMDDAECEVALSFEGRPSVNWTVEDEGDIDGFVDAWYDDEGRQLGQAMGTNLRQFVDGFSYGSGASVSIRVRRTGNLHHVWEVVFRAVGDAVATAVDLSGCRLPGEQSGLAATCRYDVEPVARGDDS